MRAAVTPYAASLLVGGLTAWAYSAFVVTDFDALHGANEDVYITVDQFLALVGLVVGAPATLVLYVVAMSAVTSSAELSRGAKLAFHALHVLLLAALLAARKRICCERSSEWVCRKAYSRCQRVQKALR